jgi:simple sugar transport system permease protein
MLVYVAESFLASVSQGLLKNPEGMGFPGSRNLRQYDSTHNAELISGSGMHWGVVVAFISVIFAYILLTQHLRGFQIRLTGEAPKAAEFAGIKPSRLVLFCLGFSGILAGMAGLFEVSGPAGQITTDFNSGYGFTANYCRLFGAAEPLGNSGSRAVDGADLYRRRVGAVDAGGSGGLDPVISRHVIILFARD